MGETFQTFVNDLGVAAYLKMHGYELAGKKDRSIYFECKTAEEAEEFKNLMMEYQPPNNEFCLFDSCLMWLKKTDYLPRNLSSLPHKIVDDLGIAAYLMLKEKDKETRLGIKVLGRQGSAVYFQCPEEKEEEFDRRCFTYLKSQFHTYDQELMSIKKVGGICRSTLK